MGVSQTKSKILSNSNASRGGEVDAGKACLMDVLVTNYDQTMETFGNLPDDQKSKIAEALGDDLIEAFTSSKNQCESQLEMIDDHEARFDQLAKVLQDME